MRLILDRGDFYRVRRGQTPSMIESVLNFPVKECFDGAVLPVEACTVHIVRTGETYFSIASDYGTEEETLKNFNNFRPLYPSCRVFIP